MDAWAEKLYRLIKLIRPRAYNVIAKTVIGLGVALVAESQLNIIQALVISLYEITVGPPLLLIELLRNTTDTWVGVFLITIGLFYHYLVTVGYAQVESKLSLIPQKPNFDLEILNADLVPYEGNEIKLRGYIVNAPSQEDIPEFRVNYIYPGIHGLSNVLNSIGNATKDPEFYKKRSEFLKVWGGSELITVSIFNRSAILATGVKVEICFPRIKGVSADNTNKDCPILPSDSKHNSFSVISPVQSFERDIYDLKRAHTDTQYCFYWAVGQVQANTKVTSNTYLFLRTDKSISAEITVYCDQISSPIKQSYSVISSSNTLDVSVSDLMSDDNQFNELACKCVMDGYIMRKTLRKLHDYEHKRQELLP